MTASELALRAKAVAAEGPLRRRLFLFALLATVFDGAEITIVSYFIPALTQHFPIAASDVVRTLMYQNLASLAGGLLFGWLGDRFGRRWTLCATVLVYGLSTVWGAFATTFAAFTWSRVAAGLGIGGEFGAAFAIFNEIWPTKSRGTVGGVVQAMFVLGMLISTVVSYLAFGWLTFSWQGAFLVIGLASLAIAAGIALFMPESPLWEADRARRRSGGPKAVAASPLLEILAGARLGLSARAALFAAGLFYASYSINTFLPSVALSALPRGTATLVLVWAQLLVGLAIVATGWLADRWGRRPAALAGLAIAILAYGAYWVVRQGEVDPAYWRSSVFWTILAIQVGTGAFGVIGVWLGELYPTRMRVTGENFGYYVGRGLGASLGPYAAILVAPVPRDALGLGVVGAALALVFAASLPETRGRELAELDREPTAEAAL
ncbi:MAG: MFS transporter [Clostridia bacterium]|nr:MFS transporter [Clostridia bacterium]